MTITKQIIAFTRGKLLATGKGQSESIERLENLQRLVDKMLHYGYALDSALLENLSLSDIQEVLADVIPLLQAQYHSGEKFKSLHAPGFDGTMSNDELMDLQEKIYSGEVNISEYINSHWYVADKGKDHEREVLSELTPDAFMKVPQSIMASGNSLQETTKAELVWFLKTYPDLSIPERIPFKETLCIVMSHRPDLKPRDINDILRYAFWVMGSDPCLPNVPKQIQENTWRRSSRVDNPEWRKLNSLGRSQRRHILSLINTIVDEKGLKSLIPDAKRFYGHWVLLSERLHSGDYKNVYPLALEFFNTLQTREKSKKYKTWESGMQKLYDEKKDLHEIAEYIAKRPGELVRRFDSLTRRARKDGQESDIMDIFLDTPGMKNKTLLELMTYYDKRRGAAPRFVSTKGSRQMYRLPYLEALPDEMLEFIQDILVRKVLLNIDSRITEKDLLGQNVYLDPGLKNMPVPRDMRSATTIIPPGTKFDIPEDIKVIRFFVHWIQKPGREEDLDLHAYLLSEDYKKEEQVGFNSSLRRQYASHSGDVLNRPGDCAEYIDIDISEALNLGWRYVVQDVCNFKGRGYTDLDSWLGFSYRDRVEGGNKNWKPCDQVVCERIKSTTSNIAAWVFDLKERKAILLDVDINSIPIPQGQRREPSIVQFFTAPQKFSTYDILQQTYISRGATVLSEKPASDSGIEYSEVLASDLVKDYTRVLEAIGE